MSSDENRNLWGVILAGGEGERVQSFPRRVVADVRPKQFCAITGRHSMLRHTLDRAQVLIPPQRTLTIITHHHMRYAQEQLSDRPPGTVVVQPSSRGTGVGILLPLLKIRKRHADSIVVVFPADHFVIDKERFMYHVASAARIVHADPSVVVILGVNPNRAESGYGWVERGSRIERCQGAILHRVRRFWEKPAEKTAQTLFDNGCLWNTFVLVGHTSVLLNHLRSVVPEIYEPLHSVQDILDTTAEGGAIMEVFEHLPSADFSRAVLQKIPEHLRVLELTGVYWSDWGEAHRILHEVERFNMRIHGGRSRRGAVPSGVGSLAMR